MIIYNIIILIIQFSQITIIISTSSHFVITLQTAAHMMCAEASRNWTECRAVMQIALNRSQKYNKSLTEIITAKNQFFLKCNPKVIHFTHYYLAFKAITKKHMQVPKWLKDKRITMFCTQDVAYKWYNKHTPINQLIHIYWIPKSIEGQP